MKIQHITEGVRKSNDGFTLDMKQDYESDIIKTYISNDLYMSEIDDNIYYLVISLKILSQVKIEQNL